MFGSWVNVISDRRPKLPKTRSWNTSSETLKRHRKSRIQRNSIFFFAQMLRIISGFVLAKKKKKNGVRCTLVDFGNKVINKFSIQLGCRVIVYNQAEIAKKATKQSKPNRQNKQNQN